MVYLLLVLVAAPAHAEWDTGNTGTGWYQTPGPRNFFDVKRAQTFWSELRTRVQLDAYIAKNCPKGGPYDAWKQDYNDDHAKAMGAVKSDPNAAKIMACHDLQVAIYVWRNLYVKIVKVPDVVRVRFNHAEEGGQYCRALASWNFVTHKCNDLPDWRTAGGVKDEEDFIARQETHARKAKTN
ncbi:hypothetical protein [Ferrovibrio xuzhouensis]|uniref:Uncharacterized protein n=1 Tax=Ferrovibrio xuzhouensis TaxID=1576914 RepID=A0ABV7VDQ6_9PROT